MSTANTMPEFLMRTDEEILARIIEVQKSGRDAMGFERRDLRMYLPFAKVWPYLRPSITEDQWKPVARDRDSIIETMLDYMPFAFTKANDCRGISAFRSMGHYMTWTWMAGDDFGDLTQYHFYGKENLCRICEHYGWDPTLWDNGERVG